ncbi:ATPase AAA [Robbsia andropogonis]|uniref:ATPase AAA n=1 Tax=Robbsia andropogonis TaxID=28092 RepID=A0A0F5K2E2_9BURK|nr:AAA family ATPase [Robbsia andropogonis]KKB63717.1 ATPase AAA [Robbsia andropogonis]MCP1119267.1 AAA family ATPase [Robbsia andropogonis]MCP1129107.1 AAA family ATPase [Robbsia andropogonis]
MTIRHSPSASLLAPDDALLGEYAHPGNEGAGRWHVSRSDRPNLYRIQHGLPGQSVKVDTVVDLDNLHAKLNKWQREGFVKRTVDRDTSSFSHPTFMPDLRDAAARLHAVERANDRAGVTIGHVVVPTGTGGPLVPPVNNAYLFAARSDDVLRDVNENRRIMLIGHTGTGKTSLIEQAAARCKQGVLRANMNGQTSVGDFVGFWTVKGGETVWVDGVLPIAMRQGLWLIIDEIDFAEPAILSVLTAVLEPGGNLMLKEKGNEIIAPHPAFRLFATANAVGAMSRFRHLYQGANLMNEAFLDRWRVYLIDYLSPEDEAVVLRQTFNSLSDGMARTLAAIAADCRAAFIREDIGSAFSTRRLLDWTAMMLRTGDPEIAAGPTIYAKVDAEDAALIGSIIRHHIAIDIEGDA